MIDDRATDDFADRIINILGVGNDWLDLYVCDMLVRTESHAAGDQNLAVRHVRGHRPVFPL